mmetsp:Transcript_47559/g.113207  ORF Transcript_47559/g.113207 Transcript_47559/m.113207 type:complete len:245 (+) Transcript_47559:2304-3038(+)
MPCGDLQAHRGARYLHAVPGRHLQARGGRREPCCVPCVPEEQQFGYGGGRRCDRVLVPRWPHASRDRVRRPGVRRVRDRDLQGRYGQRRMHEVPRRDILEHPWRRLDRRVRLLPGRLLDVVGFRGVRVLRVRQGLLGRPGDRAVRQVRARNLQGRDRERRVPQVPGEHVFGDVPRFVRLMQAVPHLDDVGCGKLGVHQRRGRGHGVVDNRDVQGHLRRTRADVPGRVRRRSRNGPRVRQDRVIY